MSKVFFGLSKVMIAKRTVTSGNVVSYSQPVSLPGAVSLNVENGSEAADFFADNIKYWSSAVTTSLTVELEMADLTRDFMTTYLSYVEAEGGGYMLTNASNSTAFALLFAVETDESQRRFCLYNCTASEGDTEHSTIEDTAEPGTVTVTINVAGEELANGSQVFKLVCESTDANYGTFFTASPSIPAVAA
jgi:phi13 family phage major tail protein